MTPNPFSTLARWSAASQQQARRNAMVASTALAARRREREEVHAFLAARTGPPRQALPAPPSLAEAGLG